MYVLRVSILPLFLSVPIGWYFCLSFEGTIRNKDGEQVALHRSRESQGRFHLFKSSWNNLKHEPFILGLSMQLNCTTSNRFSLNWPAFDNFIVSLGLQANFLPESYLMDFIAIDCCFSTKLVVILMLAR
jgi:hypothetical protein